MMQKNEIIDKLKARITAIEWNEQASINSYPLGIQEIDSALKHGGLLAGSCHEIICVEDGPSLGFAISLLASMIKKNNRPILWCSSDDDFYTPGFKNLGVDDVDIIFAKTVTKKQSLAAAEQGLACRDFTAVVITAYNLSLTEGRRLKLIAKKHNTIAILLLKANNGIMTNIATTRWQINSQPSIGKASRNGVRGVGAPRLTINLLRNLGGIAPLSWTVELDEQTLRFYTLSQFLPSANQDNKKRSLIGAGKRTA